ncbi:RsmB/NOP family class I SAM-dependent RNA methyltransferase [Nitrospirillum pindoramense]|uniref:16S rRNA (Cytosine967-C5)-methyltransferase n=1 Tax=Nitrospirillum amazonense TaxID=28077 RepID=A0A560GM96_9PROT|nr:RsmB/NOP family class I SAM-dependent RNA methyltransferase [Nitrospirillum amazonense]TWB35117.1 16S rRNA (cytosine967-C5)-methyltransferase [Nitrospirillum amazonense]
MTPTARLQAAIDLLTEVLATPRPADAVASAFFRARRYIGAKDRTDVAEKVYGILRRWARLHWWLNRAGYGGANADGTAQPAVDARALLIADELLTRGRSASSVAEHFNGGKFAPLPLEAHERALIQALETHTLEHPQQPDAVVAEVPDWAADTLRNALGERFVPEMQAMLGAAPMDLRVNPVKGTREQALAALAKAGVQAEPTKISALGIRVRNRFPIATLKAFQDGLLEIQDEGSQLVAFAANPQPGQQVVDFCAGAGGKTLAIAAMMANKGRVIACDVLDGRLKRAQERFRRAGLHNIETRPLKSARDPWVKRHKGRFDRVVVDAPCSGTGTWRRNPDARWRQLGPGLSELLPLQAEILDSAARLVRPGGRLVYATCSLLPEENQDQVTSFLASHPDFTLLPVTEAWPEGMGAPPSTNGMLSLSPARHDTDGFFAAVMVRKEAAAGAPDADELEAEEAGEDATET